VIALRSGAYPLVFFARMMVVLFFIVLLLPGSEVALTGRAAKAAKTHLSRDGVETSFRNFVDEKYA
jgi:hypothetical protein